MESTQSIKLIATATATLHDKVKELAVELCGISLGYIGNRESWGNNRGGRAQPVSKMASNASQ